MSLEVEQRFQSCLSVSNKRGCPPSISDGLELYGFLKQATKGDNSKAKPSAFHVVERAKWDAWTKKSGLSREEAMSGFAEKYGQTLGPYLSSYVLMATALDRHQAICYPLTYCSWTSRRSKAMMYVAWTASLLFCIPQVKIFSYQEVAPGVHDCWGTFNEEWGEQAYVIWYSVSIFIIPLLVLVYTYSCICREIWRCSESTLRPRTTSNESTKRNRVTLISRAKINTVKQTVAVIVMYIMCSAPFIVAQLWATIDPKSSFLEGSTFTILTLLYSLNSCVNPWIYLAFNRELRKLLISHFTWSNRNYRAAGEGQTVSNSSGEQVTSLKFSRYSPGRAGFNGRKWLVTST